MQSTGGKRPGGPEPAAPARGERVARLRHVVHGGAWPDHELARAVVRSAGRERGPGPEASRGGSAGAAADGEAGDGDGDGRAWQRVHALVAQLGPAERLTGDVERLAAVHEWAVVADADGTLHALVEGHAGVAGLVADAALAGRDDLRPLLRELESGGIAGVALAVEAGGGAIATTAVHDPATGGFTLDTPGPRARKLHRSPLPPPGRRVVAVVLARLVVDGGDRGVQPFLVPLGDGCDGGAERRRGDGRDGSPPGVEIGPLEIAPGLPGRCAAVALTAVALPPAALLLGDAARRPLLDASVEHAGVVRAPWASRERSARICRAAAAGAAMRVAAATALRGAQAAEAVLPGGGRVPQLALRSRQRALVGALADAYAITSLANAAKHAFEEDRGDGGSERLRHRAAAAQALATELARDGIAACRAGCGPHGGAVSERLRALADCLDRTAADAGGALAPLGVVARGQLTGDGYEALAPVPRPVGELDLRDPAWWTWVARTAERHSHARAVVRRRDALRRRQADEDAVWNDVLPDALDVARRHAVRRTIEALVDDADRLSDGSGEQMALLRLGALWYVREVDRDAAYLAGHGIVDGETLALLPDLADHLADLILPSLPLLLDAFALDDELLRLPATPPAHPPAPAPVPAPAGRRAGAVPTRAAVSAPAA